MHPDIESRFYDYLQSHNYASRHATFEHLHTYLAFFEKGERVLDVGCGRGEFLELLAGKGCLAEGVDSDPGMVAACRGKGLSVHKEDAFAFLRSKPEVYDGVFASNFVEHFSPAQVADLFRAAHRALRNGGKLLIAVPNPESMIVHLYEFWRDATHIRLYNRQLVEFLMVYSEFEIIAAGENEATRWQPDLAETHFPPTDVPKLGAPPQPLATQVTQSPPRQLTPAVESEAAHMTFALSDPVVFPAMPGRAPDTLASTSSSPKRSSLRRAAIWIRDQLSRVLVEPVTLRHVAALRETLAHLEQDNESVHSFLNSLMPALGAASGRTRHDIQELATSLAEANNTTARLGTAQMQIAERLSLLEADLAGLQLGLQGAVEDQAQLVTTMRQMEQNARTLAAAMSSLRASLLFMYPPREVYVLGRRKEEG